MLELVLVGIGTGNPDHLTLQAIKALNSADLIMIPRKGADKADLADLRQQICAAVVTNPATRIAEFDLPARDAGIADYLMRVEDWHDTIAAVWTRTIASHADIRRVALLVWGDPSLYDSTLRIAARLTPLPKISVIPGITSMQVLTAAHAIAVNDIGAAFTVTTGRQLRTTGWPAGVNTVVVMLDGECSFTTLAPEGVTIWWAAYVGMPNQIAISGALSQVSAQIVHARAQARADHGWIMDIYLLRKV